MEAGLAALGDLLSPRYSVAPSSLGESDDAAGTWIVVRGPAKKGVTALVLARRRVELRDLGAIAAIAARTNKPALLLSAYLPPAVRERLRGFGIGYWDLNGNARIGLPGIDLCLERDGAAPTGDKGDRHARSLCGEMAGRVARVLIDVRPPHTLSGLAEQAHVDKSCASRLVAFLVETGLALRQPRGKIAKVHWQELLRRFALDSPLQARGESFRFLCARGVPDFLARLARSGFLHALTGETAFAGLAVAPLPSSPWWKSDRAVRSGFGPDARSSEAPNTRGIQASGDAADGPEPARTATRRLSPRAARAAVLYVDDVQAAVAQFGLHPAGDAADVIMVKSADHSVFQRSREYRGLRYVSPSLMAADLGDGDAFEAALGWMAAHESAWRQP